MPELSCFFGIAIYLNHDDAKQHHKPHFHARYGEHEASIPLDGILLAGSLPPKQMKLVVAWAALHETELEENWYLAQTHGNCFRIEPLY